VISQKFVQFAGDQKTLRPMRKLPRSWASACQTPISAGSEKNDGVAIVDAKPDNFIISIEGLVSIDLQRARLPEDALKAMEEPRLTI
jgi:hypothetical protein